MKTESPGDKLRATHLHRWQKLHQVNLGLATMAQQLAVGADWAYQVMSWLRDREIDRHLPARPAPAQWLHLYRRGWRVLFGVADRVPNAWGKSHHVERTLRWAGRVQRMARDEPEEFETYVRELGNRRVARLLALGWRKAVLAYWRNLGDLQGDLSTGERDDTAFGELLKASPELQFFLLVTLRCFIEYEESPDDLMKRARAGDDGAIEKLVRVDATVIHEPLIARWMNDGPGDVRAARMEMVAGWMKDGVNGRFAPPRIRQSLAGLASALSEVFNFEIQKDGKVKQRPLTARQLQGLFDAVAYDRGCEGGDAYLDGINLDGWQKGIQRHKKLWQTTLRLGVDKSRAK